MMRFVLLAMLMVACHSSEITWRKFGRGCSGSPDSTDTFEGGKCINTPTVPTSPAKLSCNASEPTKVYLVYYDDLECTQGPYPVVWDTKTCYTDALASSKVACTTF
eukprot:NODE_2809_length_467_cov_158.988038_g2191_i1.p1 GENE.NODE_2809_length_467_cov_158.988038_g2191_i1~~NODE_2809_length_467_cov_158.988038_g2191_i1.p1  ORF type:complete len:106 (-),score=10.35 NODE_2809_length_467_cov_158.988038_g2191_i1:96-413(-)